ncbi:MAG: peptide chain release factor N(5)-glutamine methyltransferase [bacterium]|nr:peptide chain release factor N(5)-glutamine methyltransferase [bacterium]
MMEQLPKFIADKGKILQAAGIEQGPAEIEIIFCFLLEVDRLHLHLYGPTLINDNVLEKFDLILTRRKNREPLQYILEEAWFYGRRFFVSPAVMIPTPETELLCESAIRFLRKEAFESPRLLDVGVGSGVISVTMAAEVPSASLLSLDISADAIAVAQRNAETHSVLDRIVFRESDMLQGLDLSEKFELILSNPPYISDEEYQSLPPEVLADPKIALTSGEQGMDAIIELLRSAPAHLAPGGRIMFEIGYNQAEPVMDATAGMKEYSSIVVLKDLNDIDRLVILTCSE